MAAFLPDVPAHLSAAETRKGPEPSRKVLGQAERLYSMCLERLETKKFPLNVQACDDVMLEVHVHDPEAVDMVCVALRRAGYAVTTSATSRWYRSCYSDTDIVNVDVPVLHIDNPLVVVTAAAAKS